MSPCARVYRKMSLVSSSLHLQPCPACLICFGWFGRWEVSSRKAAVLLGTAFRICSKQHSCVVPNLLFFSRRFVKSKGCIHSVALTRQLNSIFFLSERWDVYIVNNFSIAVYAFPVHMLTWLSVDKILISRYVKWSTNVCHLIRWCYYLD